MGHRDRTGWGMFLISAALFTWAGIRSGDLAVIAGSVVFGLACVLFLLPERSSASEPDRGPAPDTARTAGLPSPPEAG